MIDFIDCTVNKFKAYGRKKDYYFPRRHTPYVLKFPPLTSKSKAMIYINDRFENFSNKPLHDEQFVTDRKENLFVDSAGVIHGILTIDPDLVEFRFMEYGATLHKT